MLKDTFSKSLAGCLAAGMLLVGCSGDDAAEPQPRAFALEFAATADGKPVGCEDSIEGLGADGSYTLGLSDLRFYVSNLKLWNREQQEVALTLDESDFHYASDAGEVSLVDLTSNAKGTCAGDALAFTEGTKRTNTAITGTTVVESVKSVSFDIGVPQGVMQEVIASHTAEGAPSPLGEMQWTWASGYRHFVLNFAVTAEDGQSGEGNVHVGSRDCGPGDGLALEDRDRCGFVNTPQVELNDFNLDDNAVSLDLRALLSDLDFVSSVYDLDTFEVIGEGPGVECHSAPTQADCSTVFEHLGLDLDTGAAEPSHNVVFGVQ